MWHEIETTEEFSETSMIVSSLPRLVGPFSETITPFNYSGAPLPRSVDEKK